MLRVFKLFSIEVNFANFFVALKYNFALSVFYSMLVKFYKIGEVQLPRFNLETFTRHSNIKRIH